MVLVLAACFMYSSISSHGTTSLGSSMGFRARSMSGSRCSMVPIRFSQITVQNHLLSADALPSRILMRISKSQASLRMRAGLSAQKGSRSW